MGEGQGFSLGSRLREARERAGLTAQGLAEKVSAEVSANTIWAWEVGAEVPEGRFRSRLAAELRVPYHTLFVPEEVAEGLQPIERDFLLKARRISRGGASLYVDTEVPVDHVAAIGLRQLWLIEHYGYLADDRERYRVTGPGEDVLTIERRRPLPA